MLKVYILPRIFVIDESIPLWKNLHVYFYPQVEIPFFLKLTKQSLTTG
jgi:hypothetical protein